MSPDRVLRQSLSGAVAEGEAVRGERSVAGIYLRRVPLATPLALTIERDDAATRLRLSDGATTLVEGTVLAPAAPGALAPPTRETALPVSTTCFACGTDSTLGLRARLTLDDETIGGVWTPREAFRGQDGAVAPVAVTTLLDEAAFWLGAAASGESGMTTDLRVRLYRPVAFGRVVVAGSRAVVRPRADDARYWDTEVAAWDEAGALVAGLLAMNTPDVLRRVFPAYVR